MIQCVFSLLFTTHCAVHSSITILWEISRSENFSYNFFSVYKSLLCCSFYLQFIALLLFLFKIHCIVACFLNYNSLHYDLFLSKLAAITVIIDIFLYTCLSFLVKFLGKIFLKFCSNNLVYWWRCCPKNVFDVGVCHWLHSQVSHFW